MKHAELRAVVHNVADSLASGWGDMIGVYDLDVFGEAARAPHGAITADFLAGLIIGGRPSSTLSRAVSLYRDALVERVTSAGWSIKNTSEAKARFWSDALEPRFSVTIADVSGRRSTVNYAGTPGRRTTVLDGLGRIRPSPIIR